MGKKPLDILCRQLVRMGRAAIEVDRAEYPLAIGLLGTRNDDIATHHAPDP